MKTIKLFVKFAFTSLSRDAQPVSMAVVSEDIKIDRTLDNHLVNTGEMSTRKFLSRYMEDTCVKSFYAEFTDFEIERCDNWVKENVISQCSGRSNLYIEDEVSREYGDLKHITYCLREWISQFEDYNIQFVVDCSYLGSMWIFDMLDERDSECCTKKFKPTEDGSFDRETIVKMVDESIRIEKGGVERCKKGLPKFTVNVSLVTEDLNSLIAFRKGILTSEAFELDREELCHGSVVVSDGKGMSDDSKLIAKGNKGNALYDAKVIKGIYNKLI